MLSETLLTGKKKKKEDVMKLGSFLSTSSIDAIVFDNRSKT